MNAPLPEIHLRSSSTPQEDLPLATNGVLRYVWESRWGSMLIEIVAGVVYLNGDRVESADHDGT